MNKDILTLAGRNFNFNNWISNHYKKSDIVVKILLALGLLSALFAVLISKIWILIPSAILFLTSILFNRLLFIKVIKKVTGVKIQLISISKYDNLYDLKVQLLNKLLLEKYPELNIDDIKVKINTFIRRSQNRSAFNLSINIALIFSLFVSIWAPVWNKYLSLLDIYVAVGEAKVLSLGLFMIVVMVYYLLFIFNVQTSTSKKLNLEIAEMLEDLIEVRIFESKTPAIPTFSEN